MRAPPITIRCDCGETEYVAYGERWQCPSCGRRWNTGQIPAEEYWGLLREMRRFRFTAIAAAIVIGVSFTVLGLLIGTQFFLLLPIVLGGWYIWYMPLWRRKVRRRARSAPKWKLHPD